MKEILFTEYGSPELLQLREVEKPAIESNQTLVKLYATTVTSGDVRMRRGTRESLPMWPLSKLAIGFTKPRQTMLGVEIAGEVVEVGQDVKRFKKGDKIFGFRGKGTNAEYVTLTEQAAVAPLPNNMTYEEAASIPFGFESAFWFLNQAKLQRGQKVLIYAASGSVGTAAVQIAKQLGAEVTGVCSTKNLDLVKSLGADHVIDYTREDFTKNGKTYDIIFDTLGKTSFSNVKNSLNENGRYALAVFGYTQILQALWASVFGSKKFVVGISDGTSEMMLRAKELVETGKFRAVIDRCYPLEQIVEAHRYVERGHKRGNVVITMGHPALG